MREAITHCEAGIGIWNWAGTELLDTEPDVVMACAGDVPTLETLAAVDLLRKTLPDLKIRVVNVVDLMTLASNDSMLELMDRLGFEAFGAEDDPSLVDVVKVL